MNKQKQKPNRKDKKKNVKGDAFQRVEFLKEAAQLNLAVNPHNEELSRHYMKCLWSVKQKKCLKLDKETKQSLCRGCNMILILGTTTRVRVGDHKRINVTCLSCNRKKRVNIRGKRKSCETKQKETAVNTFKPDEIKQ